MGRRWLIVGLIASVVANLALVGFLVGTTMGPPAWRPVPFDVAAGLGRMVRFLPEDRRTEVFGDIDPRREVRTALRTMRRAQHGIEAAMSAEPFDPDALAAALDEFREQFATSQQGSHAAFVTVMQRLTPDERRQLVDSMRHMRDPRHHRGRDRERRRD